MGCENSSQEKQDPVDTWRPDDPYPEDDAPGPYPMPEAPNIMAEDEDGQQEPETVVPIWIPQECTPMAVENSPSPP